jgi:plasmid replication initiation protein
VIAVTQQELDNISTKELIAISNEFILDARYPQLNKDELRLILCMLSLINKDDEDFKRYRIAIKDIMQIYKISHKDYVKRLDDATDGLMKKIIKLNTEGYEFNKVAWCSSAKLVEKKYIELSFHPDLKPFLLVLKGNFTSFDYSEAIFLGGFYAYKIFQLVKCFQGMGVVTGEISRKVELEWLRDYLEIRPGMYKSFGPFRHKVLEPARKEIEKDTSVIWSYEPIKTGRKITALNFLWKDNTGQKQSRLPFPAINEYDTVGQRLKELGFTDWANMREYLPTEKDWELAFDNLEHEKETRKKRNEIVDNPGGWLRSQLKKIEKGSPYSPTPQFKKYLIEEEKRKEQGKRKAEQIRKQLEEAERAKKQEEEKKVKIELKIKEIGPKEWESLKSEARKIVQKRIKKPKITAAAKQEAAKLKLSKIAKAERIKIEKEALNNTKEAFLHFGGAVSENSQAFKTACENEKVKIIESQYVLAIQGMEDYKKRIEKQIEIDARVLLVKKYKIATSLSPSNLSDLNN